MVKKRGVVWNYFTKKIHGSQITAFCKFCDQSYIQNATRMEKHIERCVKCPENIRRDFMKLVTNKRVKSMISLKLAENWSNQPHTLPNDLCNENYESAKDWPYRDELNHSIPDNTTSDNDNPDSKTWNKNIQTNSANSEEAIVNREWDSINTNRETQHVPIDEEELADESNLSETNHYNRFSQLPISSGHTISNFDLEKQILHEQYLERRALRQVAELELQKKALELEKFQWEYQQEKTQTEMRWAHECRLMQLKEEQQRQLVEQCHGRTISSKAN